MMTPRNNDQILPNWILRFDEVSNNVYNIVLTDGSGRQAVTTDHDLYRGVGTCEGHAFDIEKQVSKDWSRFLFAYSMLKLQELVTFSNGDPKNAFGTWGIIVKDKTLTYEGRDDVLIAKDNNAPLSEYRAMALKDISFKDFNKYIAFMKQDEHHSI